VRKRNKFEKIFRPSPVARAAMRSFFQATAAAATAATTRKHASAPPSSPGRRRGGSDDAFYDCAEPECEADCAYANGALKIPLNSSLLPLAVAHSDAAAPRNAWTPLPSARVFRVRQGPSYAVHRRKLPAEDPPLYTVLAVDVFSSPAKVLNLAARMDLPRVKTSSGSVPEFFVVNFMLPLDLPSLLKNTDDGPTVCMHVVLQLSDWARAHPDHAAVRLLERFVGHCQEGGSMRERLKIIFQVCNRDELNLNMPVGMAYDKYNGLPFLFRTYNSTYVRDGGCFIANFDCHKSGYAARLGRYGLLAIAHKIVCQCAFLVESQADDEMPERLLGCFTVHRLDVLHAKPLPVA